MLQDREQMNAFDKDSKFDFLGAGAAGGDGGR